MSKNVLITGADGFIGRALKAELKTDGYNVSGFDTTDDDIAGSDLLQIIGGREFQHIFHLAAKSFVPDSWDNPGNFYRTNVLGTVNVLEYCRQTSVPLTFVSAYLYGQPERLPIKEGDPVQPNNPYAHSKLLAENACEFYSREFQVNVTIIRPFNVYGIGQNVNFLIPYIVQQALKSNCITVKDLKPRRDYVFVDDLVAALKKTLTRITPFDVYNIGSGYSLSVEEVINIIQKITGTKKKIISGDEIRGNEISDTIADISRAKRDLGWLPAHTFYDGMTKVIEYEQGKSHAETSANQ